MRVLFQYLAAGRGGGFTNMAMLIRAIAEEFPSDELHVVCSEVLHSEILDGCSNLIFHGLRWPSCFELRRLEFELLGVSQMARSLNAEVIWSLNIGPYNRVLGIPSVLSVQNAFQVYPWDDCAQYHPGSALKLSMLRFFFRKSLQTSDAAIVQTPLMRQYVSHIRGAPQDILVAPKAVEHLGCTSGTRVPASVRDNVRDSAFRFCYVATASGHKNHSTIFAALERLLEEGYDCQLLVTIARDDAFRLGGERALRLVAEGSVVCVGWLNKEDLPWIYGASHACLMPSLLESLSSSHLEAMTWSKPQVVADLPFGRDTCGEAALYARPNEPSDWVLKMKELIHNSSIRESLCLRGKTRMAAFPRTWGDMAIGVRGFLHQVVCGRRS